MNYCNCPNCQTVNCPNGTAKPMAGKTIAVFGTIVDVDDEGIKVRLPPLACEGVDPSFFASDVAVVMLDEFKRMAKDAQDMREMRSILRRIMEEL